MDGVTLLDEARQAGLTVAADGDKLVIDGPRTAEAVALRLIEHKAEVMAALADETAPAPWLRVIRPNGGTSWLRRGFGHLTEGLDVEADKPSPDAPCRCGSSNWQDVPVHGGESTRRHCARCGHFIGFVRWRGSAAPNEDDTI